MYCIIFCFDQYCDFNVHIYIYISTCYTLILFFCKYAPYMKIIFFRNMFPYYEISIFSQQIISGFKLLKDDASIFCRHCISHVPDESNPWEHMNNHVRLTFNLPLPLHQKDEKVTLKSNIT